MAAASTKSYFVRLVLFSLVVSPLIILWKHYATARFQTNLGLPILLFFVVVTAVIHLALAKTGEQDPKKFIVRFMMITGIRLFGYLTVILIYALIKREAALGGTLLFLSMYMLFSAFETISLLKFLKK